MSGNLISPISGLTMREHQNNECGFKIYEDPMPDGAYTMWGSNIDFNAAPNDHRPRHIAPTRPCAVANLDLTVAERDKLRAYAFGLVSKRHLEALRVLPGASSKFCLFVTKEEYKALEAGERQLPSNYQPLLLDDLWRDTQRLTLSRQIDFTLLNLANLEPRRGFAHKLTLHLGNLGDELPEPSPEESDVRSLVGLAFGAVAGEREFMFRALADEGLVAIGPSFHYISVAPTANNHVGADYVQISPKGYRRIEELLKGRGGEAFLICRFKEPLERLYHKVYEPVGHDPEVNCPIIRVKDEEHNDQIDDRIIYKINHAAVIVVDLSGAKGEKACTNFNVAFEAGYALSLGKPIIWTLDKDKWPVNDKLPFDIQNQNVLTYDRNNLDEFREKLKFRMLAALDKAGGAGVKRLGDFLKVVHGYAFQGDYFKDVPTEYVLVTPGNFRIGGGFQDTKLKYFDGPIPDGYTLVTGDLIVTMTDLSKEADTLGFGAIVPPSTSHTYLHNQRIGKIVITQPEELDKAFASYLLRTRPYRDFVVGGASGSTVKHTSPSRIEAYETDLPPLAEQRRIAAILGSLDDKIELNRRMNATLEEMARALFRSWFVDFDPVKVKARGGDPTAELGLAPKIVSLC